jgi:hypothetical protein
MTCADFEALLDSQFGPAHLHDDDPAQIEHAAACGTCRASLERHRLLADAIGAWRAQAPEVDLTAAVMAALELDATQTLAQSEVHSAHPPSVANPGLATAARQLSQKIPSRSLKFESLSRSRRSLLATIAVLMVLFAGTSLRNSSRPANSVGPESAANSGRMTQPSDEQFSRRQSPRLARTNIVRPQQTSPYAGLVQMATGAWDEVTLLVRPEPNSVPLPESAPPERSLDGWIDGWQHRLKPIGRGLDHAFDFLWQAGQSGDG